ncbi:MAG TPA: energy transducer TonB [Rhizomicrobium sp.]|jgi:TonB family protein|nr:energy transducer TonB [Rhizomicrobium sp.]
MDSIRQTSLLFLNRGKIARRGRYATLGIVALIHFVLFWLLATAIPSETAGSGKAGGSTELEIRLISPNLASSGIPAPPTDWDFLAPEDVVVPEPEINIVPELQDPNAVHVTIMRQKLPPRLDPTHINEKPELPHTLGMVGALSLELRILVLPDGSVGDAQVARSTGEPDIDRIAIETVKGSWRYIPATINGKPIEAWTMVIVRFAAI